MFTEANSEQRSPEWFAERIGKITASDFSKIIKADGKMSSSAQGLIDKMVAEVVSGEREESYESEEMAYGKKAEDDLLPFINLVTGHNFRACGLLVSSNGFFGCSPDAIDMDSMIGVEAKHPSKHTHIKYAIQGRLPPEYKAQVQGAMLVTGFSKWLFVSRYGDMRPVIIEVQRDEEYIKSLSTILKKLKESFDYKLQMAMEYFDGE